MLELRYTLSLAQVFINVMLSLHVAVLRSSVGARGRHRAASEIFALAGVKLAIGTEGRCVVVFWYNTVHAVLELHCGVNPLPVLNPTKSSLVVNLDKVVQALLARQIAHLFFLKSFSGNGRMFEFLSVAIVQPIVKVLVCVCLLPLFVIGPEIAPVAVLDVHHLEEVLQVHHLGRLLARSSLLYPLLAIIRVSL
jgi:hypothetical protein